MDEFALIDRYFAPLADGNTALSLIDDAACLSISEAEELVVTTDTLIEGVHFVGDEPAALIAQKALRVNLSDLAAMGSSPLHYSLALSAPERCDAAWFEGFANGLANDQKHYGITLIGGDTTMTPGPLTITITAYGTVPSGHAIKRSTAQVGDIIYVTGTVGDAALGLLCAQHTLAHDPYLLERYHLPQPRTELGIALRGYASAAMDVSDGLAQDMIKLCTASNVGCQIDQSALPRSDSARAIVQHEPHRWHSILGGGDDYELLFTAAPKHADHIAGLSHETGIMITQIGNITDDSYIMKDIDGASHPLEPSGYTHFT